MKLKIALALTAVVMTAALFAGVTLEGAKCPIGDEPVTGDLSVDYKGGKVYFCCGGCPETFKANPAAYAAKANHQLFVTGQAKQTSCPLTGGPLAKGMTAKVGDSTVGFCCSDCRDKAAAAKDDAQLELVFSDAAFAKGFKVGD